MGGGDVGGVLTMPPAPASLGGLASMAGRLLGTELLALSSHGGHHLFINRIPPRLPKEDVEKIILAQLRLQPFVLQVSKCSVIPQNSLKNKGYGFITLDGAPTPSDLDAIANSLNNKLQVGCRTLGVRVCTDCHNALLGDEDAPAFSPSPGSSPPNEPGSCEPSEVHVRALVEARPHSDAVNTVKSVETPTESSVPKQREIVTATRACQLASTLLQSAAAELAKQSGSVGAGRRRKGSKQHLQPQQPQPALQMQRDLQHCAPGGVARQHSPAHNKRSADPVSSERQHSSFPRSKLVQGSGAGALTAAATAGDSPGPSAASATQGGAAPLPASPSSPPTGMVTAFEHSFLAPASTLETSKSAEQCSEAEASATDLPLQAHTSCVAKQPSQLSLGARLSQPDTELNPRSLDLHPDISNLHSNSAATAGAIAAEAAPRASAGSPRSVSSAGSASGSTSGSMSGFGSGTGMASGSPCLSGPGATSASSSASCSSSASSAMSVSVPGSVSGPGCKARRPSEPRGSVSAASLAAPGAAPLSAAGSAKGPATVPLLAPRSAPLGSTASHPAGRQSSFPGRKPNHQPQSHAGPQPHQHPYQQSRVPVARAGHGISSRAGPAGGVGSSSGMQAPMPRDHTVQHNSMPRAQIDQPAFFLQAEPPHAPQLAAQQPTAPPPATHVAIQRQHDQQHQHQPLHHVNAGAASTSMGPPKFQAQPSAGGAQLSGGARAEALVHVGTQDRSVLGAPVASFLNAMQAGQPQQPSTSQTSQQSQPVQVQHPTLRQQPSSMASGAAASLMPQQEAGAPVQGEVILNGITSIQPLARQPQQQHHHQLKQQHPKQQQQQRRANGRAGAAAAGSGSGGSIATCGGDSATSAGHIAAQSSPVGGVRADLARVGQPPMASGAGAAVGFGVAIRCNGGAGICAGVEGPGPASGRRGVPSDLSGPMGPAAYPTDLNQTTVGSVPVQPPQVVPQQHHQKQQQQHRQQHQEQRQQRQQHQQHFRAAAGSLYCPQRHVGNQPGRFQAPLRPVEFPGRANHTAFPQAPSPMVHHQGQQQAQPQTQHQAQSLQPQPQHSHPQQHSAQHQQQGMRSLMSSQVQSQHHRLPPATLQQEQLQQSQQPSHLRQQPQQQPQELSRQQQQQPPPMGSIAAPGGLGIHVMDSSGALQIGQSGPPQNQLSLPLGGLAAASAPHTALMQLQLLLGTSAPHVDDPRVGSPILHTTSAPPGLGSWRPGSLDLNFGSHLSLRGDGRGERADLLSMAQSMSQSLQLSAAAVSAAAMRAARSEELVLRPGSSDGLARTGPGTAEGEVDLDPDSADLNPLDLEPMILQLLENDDDDSPPPPYSARGANCGSAAGSTAVASAQPCSVSLSHPSFTHQQQHQQPQRQGLHSASSCQGRLAVGPVAAAALPQHQQSAVASAEGSDGVSSVQFHNTGAAAAAAMMAPWVQTGRVEPAAGVGPAQAPATSAPLSAAGLQAAAPVGAAAGMSQMHGVAAAAVPWVRSPPEGPMPAAARSAGRGFGGGGGRRGVNHGSGSRGGGRGGAGGGFGGGFRGGRGAGAVQSTSGMVAGSTPNPNMMAAVHRGNGL